MIPYHTIPYRSMMISGCIWRVSGIMHVLCMYYACIACIMHLLHSIFILKSTLIPPPTISFTFSFTIGSSIFNMSPRNFIADEKSIPINLDASLDHDHVERVLDLKQLPTAAQDVKTAADGHTVLIPQPTTDPNDPLNWSPMKKHLTLFVISVVSFMPDFVSSTGIITLLPQVA